MLKLIENNKLFFVCYFFTFFIVFFSELNKPLLATTFYFSEHRTVWGDAFFSFWTLLGEAYPYFLVAFFFYFMKKDQRNTVKIAVTGVIILIVSSILKELFDSPRPASYIEKMDLTDSFNFVKGIDIHTGATSFPSGHTASAFALWGLMAFYYAKNVYLQAFFFITAALVGLSRVYLTQHFPKDTLFGSAVGLAVAVVIEYYFDKKAITS